MNLGYTKYDYRNKEGENSRNGYSKKTLKDKLRRNRNQSAERSVTENLNHNS